MEDDWKEIFDSEQMKAIEAFNEEHDKLDAKAVGFHKTEENITLIIATKDHDTRIELQSKHGKEYMGYPVRFDVLGGPPKTGLASTIRLSAQKLREFMGF